MPSSHPTLPPCRNREPTTAEKGVLLQAQVLHGDKLLLTHSLQLCKLCTYCLLPLQKDCDLELRENDVEQERLQGSTIVYGEKVQVRVTGTDIGGLQICIGPLNAVCSL